ncbi:ATP-dependent Clp protease proteolytic subunit [Patescibacteria group bacterium]|nr:ATP-dependent Clp protease proteolytic subunit [Patescibacteria group bacterium]
MTKKVVDTDALLALNPEYAVALMRGERWALEHALRCKSLNDGEPEGFRRPFDGNPRKWCGGACPFKEGCVTCTLPEDAEMTRFNRQPENPEGFARQGIIIISGSVDEEMGVRIRKLLTIAEETGNTDTLEFRIESDGGQTRVGLEIYDYIRGARVRRRVGVVLNYARSMAAVILQACDHREASPHAKILIHHTRYKDVTLKTLKDRSQIEKMLFFAEPNERQIEKIMMKRTKRSAHEIELACDKEADMTAQEALTFGLIDAIRS